MGVPAGGCHHEAKSRYTSVAKPPNVRLVQPQVRDIVRVVGQPSFTQSYERSSVYPKMNAYIQKWIVDIGDKVKKGDVLATLFVPELVEDHGTKKATVVLDKERVALANVVVEVATAEVEAAEARLEEARAEFESYRAEAERWESETKRLETELKRGVVNPQDVLQTSNRWKSCVAMRDTAAATVLKTEAELLARRSALATAKVGVRVAEANLEVARSEEKRLKAWVDYLVLPAPFDGIVVARNANTFDFVLPTAGDPSTLVHAPYLSPSGKAAPIYVVDRTDIIRVFADIPERDANYIQIGTKASVLIRAYRDKPIASTVTRTAWALNTQSRTLRAEVDLPNPGAQLLPGMYAYAKLFIERPKVLALPVSALMHLGDKTVLKVGEKTFVWMYDDGRAKRTEVETGVSDGEWIEVTNRRRAGSLAASAGDQPWTPINGTEQVILGDLSTLADGAPVTVAPASGETKVARARRAQESGNSRVIANQPHEQFVSSSVTSAATAAPSN
jgi:multidrug efflux pump subunit AcrA (membrane-fusion protein)